MLKLNLSCLTKIEILDAIASHCTELGIVNSVSLPETKTQYTFALVTMALPDEMEAVANKFGDGRIGEMVLIRLEQEEQSIPSSLLRNALSAD